MTNILLYTFLPAFFNLAPSEILVIALVVLVLFGAQKIPQFMKGLGQGVREFKNAANSVKSELEKEVENAGKDKKE